MIGATTLGRSVSLGLLAAAATAILGVRPVVAQISADGVFVASAGDAVVWRSAAAHDEWQRTAGTGPRREINASLIACRVQPGTPFVVQYAIPPRGYGIEITDGPRRGCRGVALSDAVTLHKPSADHATSAPREKAGIGSGTANPRPRGSQSGHTTGQPLVPSPLVPPLPPGGALPVPPLFR